MTRVDPMFIQSTEDFIVEQFDELSRVLFDDLNQAMGCLQFYILVHTAIVSILIGVLLGIVCTNNPDRRLLWDFGPILVGALSSVLCLYCRQVGNAKQERVRRGDTAKESLQERLLERIEEGGLEEGSMKA